MLGVQPHLPLPLPLPLPLTFNHAAAHAARRVITVCAIRVDPVAGRGWWRLGKVHGRIGARRRQLIEQVVETRRPRIAPRKEFWEVE